MTQQEIQERNKEITLMLGKPLPISVSEYSALIVKTNGNYHKDWNWLMEAVDFISNYYSDEGIPMVHILNMPIFTPKVVIFIAVSDFAKLYNKNKNEKV